jgi:hypothetical protein
MEACAPALRLRDALLRGGELVAEQLDPLGGGGRQLVEGEARLGELAVPGGDLLLQRAEAEALFQQRLLAPALLDLGDQPAGAQRSGGGHQALDHRDPLPLQIHLRGEVDELGLQAADLSRQPVALGCGAHALGHDLAGEAVLLPGEAVEDGRVHVVAARGDAARRDGEERLAGLDPLAVLDMDGGDDAGLRGVDARRADGWREVARDGLLPRILREGEEDDDGGGGGHHEPDQEPRLHGLQRHHLAPLPSLLLEQHRFLAEQGSALRHLLRHVWPCAADGSRGARPHPGGSAGVGLRIAKIPGCEPGRSNERGRLVSADRGVVALHRGLIAGEQRQAVEAGLRAGVGLHRGEHADDVDLVVGAGGHVVELGVGDRDEGLVGHGSSP